MRDIGEGAFACSRSIWLAAKGITSSPVPPPNRYKCTVQASCVFVVQIQESYEKNLPTFHYTSCFMVIGILIMAYFNSPYKWVVQSPLYS